MSSALRAGLALSLFVLSAQVWAQEVRFTAEYTISVATDPRNKAKAEAAAKAVQGGLSLLGGSLTAGSLIDEVSIGPQRYRVATRSDASAILQAVTSAATLSRLSEGRTGGGYPATDRFTEKRGKKEPLLVVADYARRQATYYRGREERKRESIQYRLADSATLPYVFFRQPMGRAAVTVAATDGLSTRMLVLEPKETTVTVDGRPVPAVQWTRRVASAQDPSLDLWVRKADGFPLRIRLGLNARYGLVLDQQLKRLPI